MKESGSAMETNTNGWVWPGDTRREPERPKAVRRGKSELRAPKRLFAAELSVIVAMLSGMMLSDSQLVHTTTVGGQETVFFNSPDPQFWFATVLLLVAVLLINYAVVSGR